MLSFLGSWIFRIIEGHCYRVVIIFFFYSYNCKMFSCWSLWEEVSRFGLGYSVVITIDSCFWTFLCGFVALGYSKITKLFLTGYSYNFTLLALLLCCWMLRIIVKELSLSSSDRLLFLDVVEKFLFVIIFRSWVSVVFLVVAKTSKIKRWFWIH